jgi:hypothetical protein
MQLFEATNGYMGNGSIRCLVIAKDEENAYELASKQFKKHADSQAIDIKVLGSRKPQKKSIYPETYWTRLNLTCLCEDVNFQWVSNIVEE